MNGMGGNVYAQGCPYEDARIRTMGISCHRTPLQQETGSPCLLHAVFQMDATGSAAGNFVTPGMITAPWATDGFASHSVTCGCIMASFNDVD